MDALSDARSTLDFMKRGLFDLQGTPLNSAAEAQLLALILETLFDLKAPEADAALARYLAIPANNWMDSANQSAVLTQVKHYSEAMAPLDKALQAQPNHPALLNNKCDLLAKLNRASEALPYCQAAVRAQPSEAAFFDTYADALDAAGKCPDAKVARDKAVALFPSNAHYRKKLACETR
jgi:predicted Zn-dependent protease